MVQVCCDGIVGLGAGEEICWDEAGPLVDELVEGVLPVGAGLPPHDGPSVVVHHTPTSGHISSGKRASH